MLSVETGQLNQLVDYLDENLPTGNMFNEYSLGGYLLYAITPPPKVFIDGRADMYGESILKDYNTIVTSNSEREHVLEKHDVEEKRTVVKAGSKLDALFLVNKGNVSVIGHCAGKSFLGLR